MTMTCRQGVVARGDLLKRLPPCRVDQLDFHFKIRSKAVVIDRQSFKERPDSEVLFSHRERQRLCKALCYLSGGRV